MSSISLGTGRRRRGGYRKIATPYLHSAKSSSSFFHRHKGKMLNAAKLLGTLGTAYLAYKYGRPRQIARAARPIERDIRLVAI
jgi:hypothetical protein